MHSRWKYPNIALLVVSLVLTAVLLANGWLEPLTRSIGSLGYVGIFLSGALFVSTFTIAPGAALLFTFAQSHSPVVVAVLGGVGAAAGDFIAYRFIRDHLLAELHPILKALHLYRRVSVLHSRYFAWLAPVIGAAIIASPLPDEIGLSLLGLRNINSTAFLVLAFMLNAAGIFVIAIAARGAA